MPFAFCRKGQEASCDLGDSPKITVGSDGAHLQAHSSVLFEDNKTKKLVPKGLISSALSHLQGNQPN